ncbi:MAG: CHASE2 domain-containing protein, partial [Planctomycetota bacterium]
MIARIGAWRERLRALVELRVLGLAATGLVLWVLLAWLEGITGIGDRVRDSLSPLADSRPSQDIALIVADDATVARHGGWPMDEDTQLALLEGCLRRGAAAVIWADSPMPPGTYHGRLDEAASLAGVPVVAPLLLEHDPAIGRWRRSGPAPEQTTGLQYGLARILPDPDGVARSQPTIRTVDGELVEPVAVVAVRGLGVAVPTRQVHGVHSPGPAHTRTALAAWRLLAGDLPAQLLSGRVCIIARGDSLAPGGVITPSTRDGVPMPHGEFHANAADSLLQGWHPAPLAWTWEALLAVSLCLGLARLIVGLQPLSALAFALAGAAAVLLLALLAMHFTLTGVPLLRALVVIGALTAIGLGIDLLRYQREVVGILAATHRGDWLFGTDEGLPAYDRHDLQLMLQLLDRALGSEGLILARHARRHLPVLAHHGCPPAVVQQLEAAGPLRPPAARAAAHPGKRLGLEDAQPWWALPLGTEPSAWLLCRPGEEFNPRLAEELLRPLLPHLLRQIDPADPDPGAAEVRLGFLSEEYLAAMTARLQHIEHRSRDERAVIRQTLGSLTVGLVLADGMGRCWYRNPHLEAQLQRLGVEWSGKHVFTLLGQLTRRPLGQVLDLLEPCYRDNVPVALQLHDAEDRRLELTITPARADIGGSGSRRTFLPAWPSHLMLVLGEAGGTGSTSHQRGMTQALTGRAQARLQQVLGALDRSTHVGADDHIIAARSAAHQLGDLLAIYGSSSGTRAFTAEVPVTGRRRPLDLSQLLAG